MALEEHPQEFAENYYFVPDEFDAKSGIEAIRLGRNRAKPGYHSGPRTVRYYSLHFVRRGTVELDYGSAKANLSDGDIFCLFPQQTYTYRRIDCGSPLEMTWVAFEGAMASPLLEMIPIRPSAPYVRKKLTLEVLLTLQQLLQSGNERSRRAKLMRCSLLYRLFDQLAERPGEAASADDSSKDWITVSLEYMRTHYGEPIGVRHAADHAGIHRTHFSKLFTERVGVPPSEFLRKLRMDQALRLLQETSRSVLDIGLSLGYSDAASFTRAFAQYYGCPPSRARDSFRGGKGSV